MTLFCLFLLSVWFVTNRDLYYPLDQHQIALRQSTRANPKVRLWQTDITKSDSLIVKDHPKFAGVCVIEIKVRANELLPFKPKGTPTLKRRLCRRLIEKLLVFVCI